MGHLRRSSNSATTQEHEYHVIKQNVDTSRIIQIGLTLADEHGRVPQGVCTWQFNFEFLLG
jgi:CCR4-NOT transcription complex subunit 7/8